MAAGLIPSCIHVYEYSMHNVWICTNYPWIFLCKPRILAPCNVTILLLLLLEQDQSARAALRATSISLRSPVTGLPGLDNRPTCSVGGNRYIPPVDHNIAQKKLHFTAHGIVCSMYVRVYVCICCSAQTGQHERCKRECCPVWALQQICWISLATDMYEPILVSKSLKLYKYTG